MYKHHYILIIKTTFELLAFWKVNISFTLKVRLIKIFCQEQYASWSIKCLMIDNLHEPILKNIIWLHDQKWNQKFVISVNISAYKSTHKFTNCILCHEIHWQRYCSVFFSKKATHLKHGEQHWVTPAFVYNMHLVYVQMKYRMIWSQFAFLPNYFILTSFTVKYKPCM